MHLRELAYIYIYIYMLIYADIQILLALGPLRWAMVSGTGALPGHAGGGPAATTFNPVALVRIFEVLLLLNACMEARSPPMRVAADCMLFEM